MGLRRMLGCLLLAAAWMLSPATGRAAPLKVLLCTGDYGMWAQDRAALIQGAVDKAAPAEVVFQTEQTFNFVKKLEAPGYAERFDVIAFGDVGLGQMTTAAQAALVRFVDNGGGLIYVVQAKSTVPFKGPRQAEPTPLAAILPYQYPDHDPAKNARPDTKAMGLDSVLLKGLDFSRTPWQKDARSKDSPLVLQREQGKGVVMALYGAFGASYKGISYAKYEKNPGGWDTWPELGKLWARLLTEAGVHSPIRQQSRQQVDARVQAVPLTLDVAIDATREIDEVRSSDFSIVSLSQLYQEDGGKNEDLFLALNPLGFFDRSSEKVLANTKGKKYPDKTKLFDEYHIQGILMDNNSYGSYGGWKEADWTRHIADDVAAAKRWPKYLNYFQPGNEPPCNQAYFTFHNRISQAVLKQVPDLKVIGPNSAWIGPDARAMEAFIETCGANTDVLNWHIYGRCPESVRAEVLYWTKYAQGKLRSKGPVRVMFTESDVWNTGDSQFNYLMDRAYTFLPMPEILASFQYCMDARFEGGTYHFGVLQPKGEFQANYNGYWIWRNLRGRLVQATAKASVSGGDKHCRVLASSLDGGKSVTAVAYYDAGYYDGPAGQRAEQATVTLHVKLPPGQYKLQRSDADWTTRTVTELPDVVQGQAKVGVTLAPFHAAAFTWIRQ